MIEVQGDFWKQPKMCKTYAVILDYQKDLKQNSKHIELAGLNNFFSFCQKDYTLVTDKDIVHWQLNLRDKGYTKRSVRQYCWLLKCFYKFVVLSGLIRPDKLASKLKICHRTEREKLDDHVLVNSGLKATENVIAEFLKDEQASIKRSDYHNYLEFFSDMKKELHEISSADLEDWFLILKKKGYCKASIIMKKGSLKRLFDYSLEKKYVKEDLVNLKVRECLDEDMWNKYGLEKTLQMIEQFQKDYEHRMKKKTLKQYRYVYYRFFKNCKKNVDEVSAKDVRKWLYFRADFMSANAINFEIVSLKTLFSYCLEEGLTNQNPMLHVAKPKIVKYLNTNCQTIDKKTMAKLMELTMDKPLEQAMISMFRSTGVRINELLQIKVEDLDLDGLLVFIRQGKERKDRFVPMTRDCAERLENLLANNPGPYVFSQTGEYPLKEGWVRSRLQHYKNELGLDRLTPHMFRYTFATILSEKGMPLTYVQVLLGHVNPETTKKYVKASTSSEKHQYDHYQ